MERAKSSAPTRPVLFHLSGPRGHCLARRATTPRRTPARRPLAMSATPSTIPSKEDSPEEGKLAARGGAPASCSSPPKQQPRRVPLVVGPETRVEPHPARGPGPRRPRHRHPFPAPRNSPPTPRPSTAEGPAPSPPRTFRGHVARGGTRRGAGFRVAHLLRAALLRPRPARASTHARRRRDARARPSRPSSRRRAKPLVEMKKAAAGATALRALGCALDRDARHVKPSLAKTPAAHAPRDGVSRGEHFRRRLRDGTRGRSRRLRRRRRGKPLAFLFPDGALWRKRDRSPERFSPDAEAEAFLASKASARRTTSTTRATT